MADCELMDVFSNYRGEVPKLLIYTYTGYYLGASLISGVGPVECETRKLGGVGRDVTILVP